MNFFRWDSGSEVGWYNDTSGSSKLTGPFETEDLASRKRYSEAGRVLLDYAKNVEEAITAFAQGGDFPEADRQVSSVAHIQRPSTDAR